MNLTEVPEVVIDSSGGFKFIVAELTDDKGRKRLVVRADKKCMSHMHILQQLHKEVDPHDFRSRVMGGGAIWVDCVAKMIRIWGKSSAFGQEPDRQQTVSMLQKTFPDFQVING